MLRMLFSRFLINFLIDGGLSGLYSVLQDFISDMLQTAWLLSFWANCFTDFYSILLDFTSKRSSPKRKATPTAGQAGQTATVPEKNAGGNGESDQELLLQLLQKHASAAFHHAQKKCRTARQNVWQFAIYTFIFSQR